MIAVFRTTGATLLSTTACPSGTHKRRRPRPPGGAGVLLADTDLGNAVYSPHLAVDERPSGPGAGNVYVMARYLFERTPSIRLAALTCGPIRLVHTETQALAARRLVAQHFSVDTRPQHDHQVDANGTETYMVWARCKVATFTDLSGRSVCPDADVVMKASNNNGATWSALTCVSCGANDQFLPAIKTDHSRNIVNIAFYASGGDATFQYRLRVYIRHIHLGGATPDPTEAHQITTILDDPSGDPLQGGFGIAIGVAARGTGVDGQSRAYVHYTYHNIQGIYHDVQVLEPNNHLSRLDY